MKAVEPLPKWYANENDSSNLGDPFSDEWFSIRVPLGFQRIEFEPPSLAKVAVRKYFWTFEGKQPSGTVFSVMFFTSSSAEKTTAPLDDFYAGYKNGLTGKLKDVQFGVVRRGLFQNAEAREGSFAGKNPESGETINGYFLLGIDDHGAYAITATLEQTVVKSETIKILRTAMLTFKRSETTNSLGDSTSEVKK